MRGYVRRQRRRRKQTTMLGSRGSSPHRSVLACRAFPAGPERTAEMASDGLKAQRAVQWSRRFSLLYALGVWTVIGYFVSRSARFREIPLEEKKGKGGRPPAPLDHNEYSRSVLPGAEEQD